MTSPTMRVLPVVLFNLLVYIVIGLPNAVLPLFVHHTLGYSTTVAGFAFSLQYFGTFGGRLVAGQLVDKIGSKPVVIFGLAACLVSGLLMACAGWISNLAPASLCLALASRLFLGWAESWTATAVTVWNINRVGAQNTSTAISWNGVTSYGGISLGVPVGLWLGHFSTPGLTAVGCASALLPLFGLMIIGRYDGIKPFPHDNAPPMALWKALRLVLPYGAGLAAGSTGFGAISTFLALYYASRQWSGIGTAMAVFGIVFILVRSLFASQIDKRGGMVVALLSLGAEALGLATLGLFSNPGSALIGTALTSAGFSLLFPALGVLAVNSAGPEYRGLTLATYSLFADLSIASVGPVLGQVIDYTGYASMFGTAALCCIAGSLISYFLGRRRLP